MPLKTVFSSTLGSPEKMICRTSWERLEKVRVLVAPYCAIPRDCLSDMESLRSGDAIPPPPQKGYLSDTCAIPYENKANGWPLGAIPGIARYGGISHWAAKVRVYQESFCFISFRMNREKAQGLGSKNLVPLDR